ncbi:MAG TPA: RecQ family ATP-dependent DNA helicase [Accumulibacter sp.]|nr:RecQ family ATP-dependent DNA helicase [Accumulibacter sp.]HMW16582.1 RecQ family ATP-dependent DNA helicase [Accumulibacter sp.]HNC17488.1 RecQ family ATP-dependent DNA helicase [Accumulibacter sp.]HND79167.1 RecQ family ATP-dependent DNA helicase [Accumulibacter sp.]HNE13744.1 RecQ family ATP-dependent DNA helicase [Accumulibacter sp.]
MTRFAFAPKCLCLDIETAIDNALDIHKFAAWRADTQASVVLQGKQIPLALEKIDALTEGAAFVLGHNVVRHDLPALATRFPSLRLNQLPAVDTLALSPIAFPANPYHSLVKDYKLVRDARNNPLKDAQLSLRLWQDQYAAFEHLHQTSPDELACHHYFLTRGSKGGVGSFFAKLRGAMPPKASAVKDAAVRLTQGKVCPRHLEPLLNQSLQDVDAGLAFSYVLAWLRVSGGNSVLPPWVRLQYPATTAFIQQLRETPCDDHQCPYCALYLNPFHELDRYFGFASFRPEPKNADGGSLQEDIVRSGYAGESLLAILPTGGGKSICYQLPALSRYWRNGSLTIVVSPLQSLMKDQVDNLVKAGIYSAATFNGMLTMPERHEVLEKVRLGDVGILLVSPEQFRNHVFVEAIRHRRIGTWVLDEAHCLSKWGNDFRPDYWHVSRFIRERYGRQSHDVAPISCFTATAKREVIDDIRHHFQESLGIELKVLDGGHERNNLHYEVMAVSKPEKPALVHRLLEKEFGDPAKTGREDGAIVFTSARKRAEDLAGFLKDMGWACANFHAGLEAGVKADIQQAFIKGDLKVIVATNAFGMGVDKPDVRIVIHAEIPGSLENYLQEAGRAGRDRQDARCVLLYDEQDVENQFSLSARSRLSRQDIAGILRTLRRYAGKTRNAEVVVTPGEILSDDELETSIEAASLDADTKVRTAVSWLERSRFLERNENHTRVFPGSLKVPNLEEAEKRLRRVDLSEDLLGKYRNLVSALINTRDDEGISTDDLMVALGASSNEVIRMLHQLERLGVLSNDLSFTVLLRKGVKDAAQERLLRLVAMEKAILQLLPELAPDADNGEWQDVNQRELCQGLKNQSGIDFIPADLMKVLHSLARPFGEGEKGRRASITVKLVRRELLKVRLLRSWANIREIAEKRRAVAGVLLQFLLRKLDEKVRGVDLRVECKMGELADALKSDLELGPQVKDDLTAIDAGLLYLHDNGVLILDRGKAIFRSAMTIRIFSEERRGFTNADFEPLKEHYNEKNFQIHVVHEYAKLGLKKLSEALNFVLAYFSLSKLDFIRRYFAGRKEILDQATTEESYRRIVESLRHPIQQRLVSDKTDTNRLILAGPGSGKTRVIVHRVAYLVRVLREPPGSIIVLTFNRGAAWEIRQRLRNLIHSDAGAVTVLTYHALACRLTGTSFANLAEQVQVTAETSSISLDGVLDKAIALLQGKSDLETSDGDELRERLLAGYRYILVDEYQDIDQRQYDLISALAGRQTADKDARLTLLAVGDDDQNIYTFRGTSNEFIHRFQTDYQAKIDYLLENYRSSANIIAAANALIAPHPHRLKIDRPIHINHARKSDPAGGPWQRWDPIVQGRTQIRAVPPDRVGQAVVVMQELLRLKSLAADSDWGDFAVLARNRATLDPFRAWCHQNNVGYGISDKESSGPRFFQTREACLLLDMLRSKPHRRLRSRGLMRWFEMRFAGQYHDNPWLNLLGLFVEELFCIWGDIPLPSSTITDELHEFGADAVRSDRGRLTLSTVHSAKGREFKHVVILDGLDWTSSSDDERRLYYVGMTRARENLILCQSASASNPFSEGINGNGVIRFPLAATVTRPEALALKYFTLGLADVDLGYAGRLEEQHRIHRVLADLTHGEKLQIFHTKRVEIRVPSSELSIGALAKKFKMPEGRLVEARLDTLVRRYKKQSAPGFAERMRVEHWYVPLVTLIILPEAETRQRAAPEFLTAG